MSDEEKDVDEPEAMEEDSAEIPVDLENEEGDENDNPNKQNAEGNDSPEPTEEDGESSEKVERLHKFPLGRIKTIMKQGKDPTRSILRLKLSNQSLCQFLLKNLLVKESLGKCLGTSLGTGPRHENGVTRGRLLDL